MTDPKPAPSAEPMEEGLLTTDELSHMASLSRSTRLHHFEARPLQKLIRAYERLAAIVPIAETLPAPFTVRMILEHGYELVEPGGKALLQAWGKVRSILLRVHTDGLSAHAALLQIIQAHDDAIEEWRAAREAPELAQKR